MDAESVGSLADRIDNIIHAGSLPMDPSVKLQLTLSSLEDIKTELRTRYIIETGENPWN